MRSLKGSQKVAGGRSAAQTTGSAGNGSTPTGCKRIVFTFSHPCGVRIIVANFSGGLR